MAGRQKQIVAADLSRRGFNSSSRIPRPTG